MKLWEWAKTLLNNKNDESIPLDATKFRWRSFIEETPGVGSSMRLVFVTVCFTVIFFWSWSAYDCIKLHKPLPELPTNVMMFALGVGGSKVVQATFGEKTS
jgi:hypothetical protein